jgi:hypothetical protein
MKLFYQEIIMLISGLSLLFYIPYEAEKNYVDAARKTWKNYPIQFISITQLNGYEKYNFFDQEDIDTFCDCTFIKDYEKPSTGKCSPMQKKDGCIEYTKNKAYNYNDINLYVKYFSADYLTLFSRVHNEEQYKGLCKTGYKRCGILDAFNNSFCISDGEKCPVNYIDIPNKNFSYIGINRHIINQIHVSESYKAKIFDINHIYTQKDMNDLKKGIGFTKDKNFYNLAYLNSSTRKSDFIESNNLIDGKMPSYFYNTDMKLYHLVYPGNLKNHQMNYFYLGLINCRLVILFIFLAIKIAMGITFFFLQNKGFIFKTWYYLFICLIFSYFVMFIFNFLFYIGRLHLHCILDYYEEHVFKSGEIIYSDYILLFIWEIIFSICDIIIIINAVILAFKLKIPKLDNSGLESGLMSVDSDIN